MGWLCRGRVGVGGDAVTHVTLDDLLDEFQRGEIAEADLRGSPDHLHGLCDWNTGRVYVNPRPGIVEILLHELIHRRHPRWGEKRVSADAKRLLEKMSDAEVSQWYRKYKAAARKRKPVNCEDYED